MTALFHRSPLAPPPRAAGGRGVYLIGSDGKEYLDGSGGAAVSCLGHGHPRVIEAIKRQADALAFAHTAFFSNDAAEALAANLVAAAPDGFGRAYFVSGGSEANETAMKLARAYHLARGEPERALIIHRRQSYHGNTLGALAVSGARARRTPYEPLLKQQPAIAPCYAYRHQEPDEDEEAYGRRVADELEAAIEQSGPGRVAAFIAEPVVGAVLGVVPAVPGYFARIREICDRHGVLWIADEVMCGMGRTGYRFACEAEGATPDIITMAKGLGGGYQPIGAMLVSNAVFETVAAGGFEGGHTYIGHAIACAAALAVQETIEEENLLPRIRAAHEVLRSRLEARFGDATWLGDIRGRGLFVGVELVADRASKAPFDPKLKLAARIKKQAQANGLICYPGSGCADGVAGDHVL
ncbi:MAG: aspartate aminotransferase family protein, partial [Maricaulaceae bacterium]